jgi:TolB-like protein/Tfp pilus assembly protein PilF
MRSVASPRSTSILWVGFFLIVACLLAAYQFWPVPEPIPLDAVRFPVFAVLDFDNLNVDPKLEYLSNSMTHEMIAKLGQLFSGRLGVIAHGSVANYEKARKSVQQIGRELGVDYILEGGIRRDGNRITVMSSLVRVSDHEQLWSENSTGNLDGLSALQLEILRKIGASLGFTITPAAEAAVVRASTDSIAAREAYLKAVDTCETRTEQATTSCIAEFERAIKADPGYARAYAGLAEAHLQRLWYGTKAPELEYAKAEEYVRRALELNDSLPEAYTVLAKLLYRYKGDLDAAAEQFKRAIALNHSEASAHLAYAEFLLEQKRLDEALAQSQQAIEFDPFSIEASLMSGRILIELRLYDRAIQRLEKAVDLNRNYSEGRYYLGRAYLASGKFDDAIREFQRTILTGGPTPVAIAALGEAYAAAGRRDDACAQLKELRRIARTRNVPKELINGLSELCGGTA